MSALTEISELAEKALLLTKELEKDSEAKDKIISALTEKVRTQENEIRRLQKARTGFIKDDPIDF